MPLFAPVISATVMRASRNRRPGRAVRDAMRASLRQPVPPRTRVVTGPPSSGPAEPGEAYRGHGQESSNPLGAFLRARRELVTPQQAGIRSAERRRVPGLRRAAVALLAGIKIGSAHVGTPVTHAHLTCC